ncbi:TPA: glycosyltransferase [Proteus mirabilis]|nr:glycosyltransferase [Proteus mirabilis]
MSVYYEEEPKRLSEALSSIYECQTYKPSQIVLVKDGPLTFELDSEISNWKMKLDKILTVIELPENVGLGEALNIGLHACKYDLVARMDTDDISLPERFEKQIKFMQNNPHIAASSAVLEEWDSNFLRLISTRKLPINSSELSKFAIRRSPLSHPLAIFRKSIVVSVGGYPSLRKAQDYALWSLLLSKGYYLSNLPDTLLKMRSGIEMLNRRDYSYFKHEIKLLKYQKEINFLSPKDFVINYCLKAIIRLSPNFFKKLAYKFAR